MNRCDKAISNKLTYDPKSSKRILRKKSSKKKSKTSSTSIRKANSYRGVPRMPPRRSLSRRGSGSRRSGSRRIVRRASSGSRNLRGVSKLSPRRSLSKKRSIKRSRSPIHRRRY